MLKFMKQLHLSIFMTMLMSFLSITKASAYDFEVDGIYYVYNSNDNSAHVTSGETKYKGSVTIPSDVTYNGRTLKVTEIGSYAFSGCDEMTSITIPSSIKEIRSYVFQGCSKLTSIRIPNNVKTIGRDVFNNSSNLKTLIFEDGDALLTEDSFYNSEKSEGFHPKYIYYGRNGTKNSSVSYWSRIIKDSLKVITFGPDVNAVGNITSSTQIIYCMNSKPADCPNFGGSLAANTVLYVPTGTKEKYATAAGWKNFFVIKEMDVEDMWNGEGEPNIDNISSEKCEKPTISYSNGKLTFYCGTNGAICQSTITDADIKSYSGNEVQLFVTYNISVYATKAGYENSRTVTATLCWIDQQPTTEGITNDVSQIPARAVLIQSQDGILTVQGVDEGSDIAVYAVSGQVVGSTKAKGNHVSLATNIKKGEIAIIKIGEKSVKVMMQ